MTPLRIVLASIILLTPSSAAFTQSSGRVRLTVMNDQSGHYNSATGPGALVAAQIAAEDFDGKILDKTIDVVALDHQNKPDVGSFACQAIL
jgi:branched-chain amino acid transport system substrate-binding protein